LAAVLAIAIAGAPAWGDEAVAALEKYRKPVDSAIDKALAYLAKQQNAKGYWPSGMGQSPAVSSLAVMAFLAKGYTPGTGPYGQNVNRGIDFVLSCQKPNGLIAGGKTHGPMYGHGISTLMLSQVSGMTDEPRQKRIDKALPHALRLILTAQKVKKSAPHKGGWRYQPHSSDSDISLTGWQLMSLRSARNNGTPVPAKAIEDAVGFVLRCRGKRRPPPKKKARPTGVGFAYQPGGAPGLARTGVATLCLELCGKHRCKEAVEGGDYVLAHLPKTYGQQHFYYGLYHCSQAMFQLGGRHWEGFAPHMYEMMLKYQRKDGSWPQGSSGEAAGGPCYATAMGVLAMAVSYRQLPIYQR
jgi:hypothetical protein